MELKEFLKLRRISLHLTMEQVAEACNVNKATVSRWESGDIGDMKSSRIKALAKILQVKPGILINDQVDIEDIQNVDNDYNALLNAVSIPLFDSISCGPGLFIDEKPTDYIAIPKSYCNPHKSYFANIAEGDSMEGKGIQDGDVLIFEQTSQVQNGQIGSFCLDWETNVCKIFRILPNKMVMLESANEKYEPILVDVSQECFRCIGKLIATFKKY